MRVWSFRLFTASGSETSEDEEGETSPRNVSQSNSDGFSDFCVRSMKLAAFGRREIELAEQELPGLTALRKKLRAEKSLRQARIVACLHLVAQNAVYFLMSFLVLRWSLPDSLLLGDGRSWLKHWWTAERKCAVVPVMSCRHKMKWLVPWHKPVFLSLLGVAKAKKTFGGRLTDVSTLPTGNLTW